MLVWNEMLFCDYECLQDCCKCINCMLLGSVVLVGMIYFIDCVMMVQLLGFDGICENFLDGVSDWDFVIEFCVVSLFIMMYLLCFFEELVLWVLAQFNFVDLLDCFCIGLFIML